MTRPAPNYALTEPARSAADAEAWAGFTAASDSGVFCTHWLAILCGQIDQVQAALLVLDSEQRDGAYAAAAVWPDAAHDVRHLGPAAERALAERRGVSLPFGAGAQAAHVAYPIELGGVLKGAVVLDLAARPVHELQAALRLIHWASAWLVDHFRQLAQAGLERSLARTGIAMDIAATALQERRFGHAAVAVVNELAARLGCQRVSIGFESKGSIVVQAISHTATFDRKTDLVRLIGEAMDEALDLDAVVVYPPADADGAEGDVGVLAHAALAHASAAVCSVPLPARGETLGIVLLERPLARPFSADEVALCATIGQLLGPLLGLHRDNERSAWQRTREGVWRGSRALFGPGHPGGKLLTLIVGAFIAVMALVPYPHRVAAKTVIEGAVRRAAVAPFEGYVAEGRVRAGDTVKRGDVLSRLDDRDLQLERARWQAERDQSDRMYRQALAGRDRAAGAIMAARVAQAQAQLSLVEEKLSRATLVAPFDGIVVSGDLSQLLGAPVEVGKVLFEIAPLDAYRVILTVDERDIAQVQPGQTGELALSGIPYERIPFEVKLVTPVASSEEGGNHFRVEARIAAHAERLRPGMEGVGKIDVGERKLLWIATHGLLDWLRLAIWRWMP